MTRFNIEIFFVKSSMLLRLRDGDKKNEWHEIVIKSAVLCEVCRHGIFHVDESSTKTSDGTPSAAPVGRQSRRE